jgi:hypothetical protein
MKVKTAELEGPALDWAVLEALKPDLKHPERAGISTFGPLFGEGYKYPSWGSAKYAPSRDWKEGGPIIEREKMDIKWVGINNCRASIAWLDGEHFEALGPTSLVAGMRCFVASRLGREVEVPDELMAQVETPNEPSPGDDRRPRARM